MNRPKIGDIIEIEISKGLVCAQYTHQHSRFGALIRVFDQEFDRPADLEAVVNKPVRFSTFFPIAAAVKRRLVRLVGSADIAAENREFPVFRDGVAIQRPKSYRFGVG
jgi:hypothetical protein